MCVCSGEVGRPVINVFVCVFVCVAMEWVVRWFTCLYVRLCV